MRVAIDAVLESGKISEASICYTGDILDPQKAKYDLWLLRKQKRLDNIERSAEVFEGMPLLQKQIKKSLKKNNITTRPLDELQRKIFTF